MPNSFRPRSTAATVSSRRQKKMRKRYLVWPIARRTPSSGSAAKGVSRMATRKMGTLASYRWVKSAGTKSEAAATRPAVNGKNTAASRRFASWNRCTRCSRRVGEEDDHCGGANASLRRQRDLQRRRGDHQPGDQRHLQTEVRELGIAELSPNREPRRVQGHGADSAQHDERERGLRQPY